VEFEEGCGIFAEIGEFSIGRGFKAALILRQGGTAEVVPCYKARDEARLPQL
jgi:hypothetical protein